MEQVKEKATEVKDKIGFGEYAAFTIGGVGIMIMFGLIGSYLLIYMTNVAFLDIAIISTIIAVSRLLDGISDIIAGNMIDKTNTKLVRSDLAPGHMRPRKDYKGLR